MKMRNKPEIQRETAGAAILHVRSGRADSRTALSALLGIAPSTVGVLADRLIADGFLSEAGLAQGGMGRPRRVLTTVPGAGWFAGVEFNAQRLQAVALDFSGRVTASAMRSLPAEVSANRVICLMLEAIIELSAKMRCSLLAVGVGAPGLVDATTGRGLHFAFIPDWNDVPVAETLADALKAPVIVQNNLRVIALAERWFGFGRDLADYAVLGPRSGFGIAQMQQGRLVEGARHMAGEIGRWPWPMAGVSGRSQELHHVLSAPATWRRLAGLPPRAPLPVDLAEGLAELAGVRGAAWKAVCMDFAQVLGCVQLLTDIGLFILHGPLTVLGDAFCEDIVLAAQETMPPLAKSDFKLVPSRLGEDAGALGAASLAMEGWAPP